MLGSRFGYRIFVFAKNTAFFIQSVIILKIMFLYLHFVLLYDIIKEEFIKTENNGFLSVNTEINARKKMQ